MLKESCLESKINNQKLKEEKLSFNISEMINLHKIQIENEKKRSVIENFLSSITLNTEISYIK